MKGNYEVVLKGNIRGKVLQNTFSLLENHAKSGLVLCVWCYANAKC